MVIGVSWNFSQILSSYLKMCFVVYDVLRKTVLVQDLFFEDIYNIKL